MILLKDRVVAHYVVGNKINSFTVQCLFIVLTARDVVTTAAGEQTSNAGETAGVSNL